MRHLMPDPIRRFVYALFLPGALVSCGRAAVSYNASLDADSPQVISTAEKGYMPVALPITRLVVQPPGSSTLNPAPAKPKVQNQNTKSAQATTPSGAASDTATSTISTSLVAEDKSVFAVSAVQVEGPTDFTVSGVNSFFSSNQFGMTYLANTRIPTTVSNTFTDETVSRIKTVASLVSTALPLLGIAAASPPGTPTCKTSSAAFQVDLGPTPSQSWSATSGCYRLTITVPQPDAHRQNTISVSTFEKQIIGASGRIWPVPACMDVKLNLIDIAQNTPLITDADFRVIDPYYVQPMPVPSKGKIAMHPICGGDLTDSPTDRWQAVFDVMSAIEAAFPKASASKTTATK